MLTIDTVFSVNDRVRSKVTGNTGTVKTLNRDTFERNKHGWCVILWDNGNISSHTLWDEDYGPKDGSGAFFQEVELMGDLDVR